MSAWIEDWERRRVLHGEDEVEDVWGGEFGASTAVWLVSHVGAHCGYFERIVAIHKSRPDLISARKGEGEEI